MHRGCWRLVGSCWPWSSVVGARSHVAKLAWLRVPAWRLGVWRSPRRGSCSTGSMSATWAVVRDSNAQPEPRRPRPTDHRGVGCGTCLSKRVPPTLGHPSVSGTAPVQEDHPGGRRQPVVGVGQPWELPGPFEMRPEAGDHHQGDRPVADALIGDADPAAVGVAGLRHGRVRRRAHRSAVGTSRKLLTGTGREMSAAPCRGLCGVLGGLVFRLSLGAFLFGLLLLPLFLQVLRSGLLHVPAALVLAGHDVLYSAPSNGGRRLHPPTPAPVATAKNRRTPDTYPGAGAMRRPPSRTCRCRAIW